MIAQNSQWLGATCARVNCNSSRGPRPSALPAPPRDASWARMAVQLARMSSTQPELPEDLWKAGSSPALQPSQQCSTASAAHTLPLQACSNVSSTKPPCQSETQLATLIDVNLAQVQLAAVHATDAQLARSSSHSLWDRCGFSGRAGPQSPRPGTGGVQQPDARPTSAEAHRSHPQLLAL